MDQILNDIDRRINESNSELAKAPADALNSEMKELLDIEWYAVMTCALLTRAHKALTVCL